MNCFRVKFLSLDQQQFYQGISENSLRIVAALRQPVMLVFLKVSSEKGRLGNQELFLCNLYSVSKLYLLV